MDSTQATGLLLIAISLALLVWHRQQQSHATRFPATDEPQRLFTRQQLRRRTQASGLIGIVGLALILFNWVPQRPIAITIYCLAILATTCWILWLAVVDGFATRNFLQRQEIDHLAAELQRAKAESDLARPSKE